MCLGVHMQRETANRDVEKWAAVRRRTAQRDTVAPTLGRRQDLGWDGSNVWW